MTGSGKSLADLAGLVGGRVIGDPGVSIEGVASIEEAGPGHITFLAHPRYRGHLDSCTASAIIVADESGVPADLNLLKVEDPQHAFAQIHGVFNPPTVHDAGISPSAVVDPTATIGPEAALYPHCYVGRNARVGEKTVLMPGATVGPGARIGSRCVLHSNVTVAEGCRIGDRVILHAGVVIGSDGFGYAGHGPGRIKVPQAGIVDIGDDVEIGANTTVDRATIGRTRIGAKTKIDNLVQIGHNVVIGERCLIVAQTGLAERAGRRRDPRRPGRGVGPRGGRGPHGHRSEGQRAPIGAAGFRAFRHSRGRSPQAVAQSDAAASEAAGSVAAGFGDRTQYPHAAVAGRQGSLVTK